MDQSPLNAVLSVPPEVTRHAAWRMRGALEYRSAVEPAVLAVRGEALADALSQCGSGELAALAGAGPASEDVASLLLDRVEMLELVEAWGHADMVELLECELPPGFGWLVYVDIEAQPAVRVVAPLWLGEGS